MTQRIRMLAVSPVAFWLGGSAVLEVGVLAFNADAVAAAIGVISLAIAGGLYAIISRCGKPLVDLIGEYRKMIAATAPQVATNTGDIADLKEQNRLYQERTRAIEEQNSLLRNEVNGLKQDAAGIGEAILIGNRDMKDPILERGKP